MVKVLCDKCGAEITKDPIRLNMTYVDVMTGDIEDPITSKEQRERDYCELCAKAVLNFAEKPEFLRIEYQADVKKKEKEHTIKEPEEDQSKPKKKLDIGKIMALKKAGWSAADIAEELGTTPQSIYSAVHTYKKKVEAVEKLGKESE